MNPGDRDTVRPTGPVAHLRVDDAGLAGSFRSALAGVPDAPARLFSAAGLGSRLAAPYPRNVMPRRVFSFGIWQSEADLDRSEADRPKPAEGRGWSVRLDPLRTWHRNHPIMEPVSGRDHDGPVLSVTISQANPSRLVSFLRASRPSERQVLAADGLIWATGFAEPPGWFATLSYWESTEAVLRFAHGTANGGAHRDAVPLVERYFKRSTVMRCRPYGGVGSLDREPALALPGTGADTSG